ATLEAVRTLAGLALLFAEGLDGQLDGLAPRIVKRFGIAASLPVSMCQPDGVTERIHLPFALVNARLHLRAIALPLADLALILVEGVCVGILEDATYLTIDDTGDELLERFVLLHQGQIRPDLRGAVAQPHRVDIARDDIGVRPAVNDFEINRGVERVGEAILE